MLYRVSLSFLLSIIIILFISACGASSPVGSQGSAAVPVANIPPGGSALTIAINFPPKPVTTGLSGLISLNTHTLDIYVSNGQSYNPASIIASTTVVAPPGGGQATGTLLIASQASNLVSIDIVSKDALGNWLGEVQEVGSVIQPGATKSITTTLVETGQGIDLVALNFPVLSRPVVYAPDGTGYTVRKVFLKSFKGAAGPTYNIAVESNMASGAVSAVIATDSLKQGAVIFSRTTPVASNGVVSGTLTFTNNGSAVGKDYRFTLDFSALSNVPTLTITQVAGGLPAPAPKNTVITQPWANNINPALIVSGMVYAATNQLKATTTPLVGATVTTTGASTTTTATGSYAMNTGVNGNVFLSAAKTGYTAQTIVVPVNGPTVQNLNLSPLGATIDNRGILTGSTTVTGVVTLPAAPVVTTAPVEILVYNSVTGHNAGSGFAFMIPGSASGTYTATVNFYNNQTTGTFIIAAKETTTTVTPPTFSTNTNSFGYAQNVPLAVNASSAVNIATIKTNPANTGTVNVAAIPANLTGMNINVSINMPGGVVSIPVSFSNITGITGGAATFTGVVPVIAGATYTVNVMASDGTATGTTAFSNATMANIPLGTYNVSLLGLPALISPPQPLPGTPVLIPANTPATLLWTSVPGAVEYYSAIRQGGYNPLIPPAAGAIPPMTYEWMGIINGVKITKPVFSPANGGNLVAGGSYWGMIETSDKVMLGNGPTFPINPFVLNVPNMNALTSRMSGIYFSITAQ